jgi:hypothetical protein
MTESTLPTTEIAPTLRTTGWLLIAASASFALVIASMIAGVAAAGFPSEEPITHDLLDPIAFWRAALGWTLLVPIGLAAYGSIVLARASRSRIPRLVTATVVVWVLTVAFTLAYAIAWQASLEFTTPTALDDPARQVALLLFGRIAIPMAAIGSAATALCLRAAGTSKRVPVVIAVIAAIIAVAFAAGVHEVAPIPPAVLIGLWIPLGVSALHQGTRARRANALPIPATT